MELQSNAFQNGETIPQQYTCAGKNIHPPLQLLGVPEAARSLALIMDDPDAPRSTFDHWIVFNIDPTTTSIEQDSSPPGATQGKNGYGVGDYRGPCPPPGAPHRYSFRLYALDTALDLPALASKSDLEQAMQGHILVQAGLIGVYGRE